VSFLEPSFQVPQPARRSDHTLVIANEMHQLADDREPGVGLERRFVGAIVLLGCLDQADGRDLLEIRPVDGPAKKLARPAPAQVLMGRYELVAILQTRVGDIALDHLPASVFRHPSDPINE